MKPDTHPTAQVSSSRMRILKNSFGFHDAHSGAIVLEDFGNDEDGDARLAKED
jgi:hypothetical protein